MLNVPLAAALIVAVFIIQLSSNPPAIAHPPVITLSPSPRPTNARDKLVLVAGRTAALAVSRVLARMGRAHPGSLLGAGFFAVFLLHAWTAPITFVNSYSIAPLRVACMALAVFLSLFADSLLHIDHAATEATTILVAMGFFRTFTDALMVVQGVAIIAILSELFRRLRAGQPRGEDIPAPADRLPDRLHS